jgi:cytochrome P450
LKELSDKYGSIFSLKVGKTTIIVLNDPRAVFELIHKKSSFYMDRSVDQHWDLAYQNENLALMHSNDTYKAMRKIVQQFLSPKNLDADLSTIQDAEYVLARLAAMI